MGIKKQAFTLVELIVVITILAILSTVAFVSFQWYAQLSRDSVRLSDMKSMEKVLKLYHLTQWEYLDPFEQWTSWAWLDSHKPILTYGPWY